MKFKLERIVLLAALLAILSGCQSKNVEENIEPSPLPSINQTEDNKPAACDDSCNEDEEKQDDLLMKDATFEDINKIIDNKGDAMVLIGFEKCPWCVDIRPVINMALSEYEALQNISYYVNVRPDGIRENDIRKSEDKEYLKFFNTVKKYLSEEKLYAPTIIFIDNGEIVSIHEGTLKGHNAKEVDLTKEQEIELKDIIIELSKKIDFMVI